MKHRALAQFLLNRAYHYSFLAIIGLTMGTIVDAVADDESAVESAVGPIEEITVTARRREEAITDVPLYVTALTEVQLENAGIEDPTDFIGKMPSISMSGDFLSPGKEFKMMVIRGVGANGGMEPAAPVFIDGVYIPRLGFDTNFMDVERVELLYGPQSTLFGRNTEGGAISIITKKPSEEFRGRVAFEWDEFDTYKAKGAVSGQIAENWFAGVSLEGSTTNGYLTNIGATNVNSFGASDDPGAFFDANLNNATDPDSNQTIGGRFALRWIPSDRFEANLTFDTYILEGGVGLPGVPKDCDCYTTDLDLVLDSEHNSSGAALRLDYDTGFGAELMSITAFRDLSSESPFDFDGGSSFGLPVGVTPGVWATEIPGVTNTHRGNIQDYRFDQDIFSQEFKLTSTSDGQFQWLVGLFYFDESFFSDRNIDIMGANQFPFFTRLQDVDADRSGWATFGQATYDLNDDVQFSFGLRYSDEESDAYNVVDWETPAFPNFMNQRLGGSHNKSFDDDNIDYSASVRWDTNENVTSFFTISTGYKSGGFQLAITGDPVADTPYFSETLTSYELGFKTNFLDHRLRANLSAFYLQLEDQQVRTIRTFNNLPFTITTNAAEATNKGINFDMVYYPVDKLQLSAALGYTDAKFDEFVIEGDLDFSGEPVRFVPEITANVGAEWTLPLSNSLIDDVTLYGNWRYVDEQLQGYDGVSVDIEFLIEDYSLLDVGARFNMGESTTFTLFANNLLDEYVAIRHWNVFLFTNPGDVPRVMSTVLPPRQFGFRVTHQF